MDIIEQLKRIADALEANNKLSQEILDYNKQIRANEMEQKIRNNKFSERSSRINITGSLSEALKNAGMSR